QGGHSGLSRVDLRVAPDIWLPVSHLRCNVTRHVPSKEGCKMSVTKREFVVGGAAVVGLSTAATRMAQAQAHASQVIGELADNEGVYVDLKEFKVHKGRARTDPTAAQLAKFEARPVSDGAIILRAKGKLYIVDAKPAGSSPQAMKDFWESIPLPLLP